MSALWLTFGIGLFILLGTVIVFIVPNHRRLVQFSIALAFGVMSTLVIFELIPESYEHLSEQMSFPFNILLLIVLTLIGILVLKLLDIIIPHHSHEHHEAHDNKKEHLENLYHIGVVTSIAFILHNMIEGMALYTAASSSFSLGLFLSIGIGLHNIPLGMVVASTFYESNKSKKKTVLMSLILSLSTFLGGLIMYFFPFENALVLGVSLSLTMGMLIYIILFELLPSMIHHKKEALTFVGAGIGIMLILVSLLFHVH